MSDDGSWMKNWEGRGGARWRQTFPHSLPLLFSFSLSPSLLRFSSPTPKLSVTDEFSTYWRPAFTAERREREGRGGERRGKDRNSKGKKPLLEIRGDVGKERGERTMEM